MHKKACTLVFTACETAGTQAPSRDSTGTNTMGYGTQTDTACCSLLILPYYLWQPTAKQWTDSQMAPSAKQVATLPSVLGGLPLHNTHCTTWSGVNYIRPARVSQHGLFTDMQPVQNKPPDQPAAWTGCSPSKLLLPPGIMTRDTHRLPKHTSCT